MDLFILKTDGEKFTSTDEKTLHLIFKYVVYFNGCVGFCVVNCTSLQFGLVFLVGLRLPIK